MGKVDDEINDAFLTIGILIRAKIEALCNKNEYDDAQKLEDAYNTINEYFDDKLVWKQTKKE